MEMDQPGSFRVSPFDGAPDPPGHASGDPGSTGTASVWGAAPGGWSRSALEQAFAEAVERRFACAVHSGTVGLFLALRACGVGPGDEVVTVGNSDVSTTAAISHCGATPALCDVSLADYTMNLDLVEPLVTPRTKAILPVDLYGHPADVRALRRSG